MLHFFEQPAVVIELLLYSRWILYPSKQAIEAIDLPDFILIDVDIFGFKFAGVADVKAVIKTGVPAFPSI